MRDGRRRRDGKGWPWVLIAQGTEGRATAAGAGGPVAEGAGTGIPLRGNLLRPSLGLSRLLHGCGSSSSEAAAAATAAGRFAASRDFGKTPESNCMKGMCRPAGKQDLNCG